ncbi:hypothetical protein [Streptomyces sindenensis]|uniref:hypothetical protein n=1 Tax=Streptomyces sindenensis TaxID=67363 RepID=UPI00167454CC|nr:hypothetical protein [Streptomyces sindenensis]GGP85540.1 hypothetical protein GCM10010231_65010 [Streptomyces sindenensis]
MTRWREILAALTDDTLDDAERGAVLAWAAVRLASDRGAAGHRPTIEEVMALACEELAVNIDTGQARAALDDWERADGERKFT